MEPPFANGVLLPLRLPVAMCTVFLLLLVSSISTVTRAQTQKTIDAVDIRADKLKVLSEKGEAHFSGNVRFKNATLQFWCDRMTIRYNDRGNILSLSATGNVKLKSKGIEAKGASAKMIMKTKVIVLRGEPSLHRNGSVLRGKSIEVNLHTGEAEITDATGTFFFDEGTIH